MARMTLVQTNWPKKTLNDTCDEGETRNETFWGETNAVLLAESLSARTVALLKYETFSYEPKDINDVAHTAPTTT